jgi:cobalamin biosynthesis protein CobW
LAKIPTTVITGFLGSGKTTLIRKLLENVGGRRLAVIVNEFGDVGVDAEILRGCGVTSCGEGDIVELANGCICCTVADDFLPALNRLLDRPDPPEHILIETSGLALPKPLIKAFAWPEIRTRATVDGVIVVIDAEAVLAGRFAGADLPGSHDKPLADLIILNKTDLVSVDEVETIKDTVRGKALPGVPVIAAAHGAVDPTVLIGLGAAAENDLAARPSHDGQSHDHGHDEFETFVVTGGAIADVDALAAALSELLVAQDILRLKGVVAVRGSPTRLIVQAVGQRLLTYFDRPWRENEPRLSSLVVIGEAGLDRSAITAALKAGLV